MDIIINTDISVCNLTNHLINADYDKLWSIFLNKTHNITDKQIDLFNKIINIEDHNYKNIIDNICKTYNITKLNELKHFQFKEIIKKYSKIKKFQINIIIKYIGEKIYDIYPDYERKDTLIQFVSNLTYTDLRSIYKQYPELTKVLSNNFFYIKNIDYIIEQNRLYEYGYQLRYIDNKITDDRLYYLRFYDWCCFDIDNKDIKIIEDRIEKLIQVVPETYVALYETNNGFHIHIMNELINYNDDKYYKLSIILKNDIWYYMFCKKHGYKLRLNKKNENEIFVSRFLKYYYGKNSKANEQCIYYKHIYDDYLTKFS